MAVEQFIQIMTYMKSVRYTILETSTARFTPFATTDTTLRPFYDLGG